ncbi:MAG: hypothetical protein K6G30_02900, partial [Acetatifactor sp.]|nr:hypothetical protein [Acetatifactor sp.]
VAKPTKVAEEVVMVWTNLKVDGYPQITGEDYPEVWSGKKKYDMEHNVIEEFGDVYPYFLSNTVVQKMDGSYWVCGENVGTEEQTVYEAEGEYSMIYTHQFLPCEN